MGLGQGVRVAGIGCRAGVSVAEVLAAVEAAGGGGLDALAVVEAKCDEAALIGAAAVLGLPLRVAGPVAEERLLTHSPASLAAVGVGSASEAAALSVAGPGARLLGPRVVVGRVTCAVAVSGEI